MKVAVLGIDLGKNSSVVGMDDTGKVIMRRRLRRMRRHEASSRPLSTTEKTVVASAGQI